MLFAVLCYLCVARPCTALGHSAQGCAGQLASMGGQSDTCQTYACGSSVTVLPCPRSVSSPCVTCVSPHTFPTLLKWTRQWGLL